MSTAALVIAVVTAGGVVVKHVHECLKNDANTNQTTQSNNVQQIVHHHQEHGIDDFVNKQLDMQRDSDTEVDIKIVVHNIPHEERLSDGTK